MDTKWKRLSTAPWGGAPKMEAGDLYQMAVYLQRFGFPQGVLLYPRASGATEDEFVVEGGTGRLRVATLDLSYPLHRDHRRTLEGLSRAIGLESASTVR